MSSIQVAIQDFMMGKGKWREREKLVHERERERALGWRGWWCNIHTLWAFIILLLPREDGEESYICSTTRDDVID